MEEIIGGVMCASTRHPKTVECLEVRERKDLGEERSQHVQMTLFNDKGHVLCCKAGEF